MRGNLSRRPRRESIDDHLAAARRRFPELSSGKEAGSRAFVRDLIRQGIIGGPYPVKKRTGPGLGVRFTPGDYRALLEILILRARGHKHRSTWLVWLWLRGRDYPLERVREAVADDLSALLKRLRAEIAPTGRFTEPFVKKYRRNIAAKRADSPFLDLGGLEESLIALTIRPQEAAGITIDLSAIAALVEGVFTVDKQAVHKALQDLVASSPDDIETATLRLAQALPPGVARTLLEEVAATSGSAVSFLAQFAGMIDDGRGKSRLLAGLEAASDEQLLNARRKIQLLRTGRMEQMARNAIVEVPAQHGEVLHFFADWARSQRHILRGNPALAANLFCVYLQADSPPMSPLPRSTVDVNAILNALRDRTAG